MLTWSWLIITLLLGPGLGLGTVEACLCALVIDFILRIWIKDKFITEEKPKRTEPLVIPTVEEMDQTIAKWTKKSSIPRDPRITESPEYLSRYMPKSN